MSREHMLNFFRAVVAGVDGTVALEEVEGKLIKINEAPVENLTREQFLRIFNRPGVFLKLTFVKEGEEESFKLLTVSSDGYTRPGRIFLSSHW
jgi:hypothetical protein